MRVLVINTGSTSAKVSVVSDGEPSTSVEAPTLVEAMEALRRSNDRGAVEAVGHRVVHGGPNTDACPIDGEVVAQIEAAVRFAPSHNPPALEGIRIAAAAYPGVPAVAVFDTAFHARLPAAAATFSGPIAWRNRGLHRFGFHGISHQYAARRAAELLGVDVASMEVVTCHLGGGSSVAAVRAGRSVDTSMGLTALDGLMMSTRSGSVDPGLLLHLLREGQTVEELAATLEHGSGLRGISGISGDLREVIAARDAANPDAALAIAMFVHRAAAGIGQMLTSLDHPSAIVFTGGIGENSPEIRERILDRFPWLGVASDPQRNVHGRGDRDIATRGSEVRALVVRSREDLAIAHEVEAVLARPAAVRWHDGVAADA